MFEHYRWAPVLLVPALLLVMGSKGCDSGGGTGVTSGGAAIMYGSPPTDITIRPVGVAVTGRHIGETLMLAAATAGTAALTEKAVRAVGGDPLEMAGDPCKGKPGDKKVAAWERKFWRPAAFFDCAGWYKVQHYATTRMKHVGTVLRCISRTISILGQRELIAGGATKFTYNFQSFTGPDGVATVIVAPGGRIISAYVDGSWQTCGGLK